MMTPKRLGLVLGGGGPLGGAWMAGALAALSEQLDRPLADVDTIVGTSAGSLLAAQVRCGIEPDRLVEIEMQADALDGRIELDSLLAEGAPFSFYPGFGSPRMLVSAAINPWRVRPMAVATALMPRGRLSLDPLAEMVGAVVTQAHLNGVDFHDHWPARGQTWIVTTDFQRGSRTVFGQSTAPRARFADAVVASCSVPGWFAPAPINGTSYVDGGVCSTTSLDLLSYQPLDHIYVLAPLASLVYDRPCGPFATARHVIRWLITRQLLNELRKVRASGISVTLLLPGPKDLAAIGPNIMDPSRRAAVVQTSLRTTREFLHKSGPADS